MADIFYTGIWNSTEMSSFCTSLNTGSVSVVLDFGWKMDTGLKQKHRLFCNFSLTLLTTYFYVIDISFDKMHFTYIWVNISRFKMIITSGYIEDMKITQEPLKKSAIYRSWYLLGRSSICQNSLKLNTCLDLSSLRDSDYSQQRFYSKRLFVYGFV